MSSDKLLFDTNVISEFRRQVPDPGVIDFLRRAEFGNSYLSVVSLSEIRFGIARMPAGRRRSELDHWAGWELPLDFRDRIILVHQAVAEAAGQIRGDAMNAGRPMGVIDAFLAATAEVEGLTLVTRNVKDFETWGGAVLNPWSG